MLSKFFIFYYSDNCINPDILYAWSLSSIQYGTTYSSGMDKSRRMCDCSSRYKCCSNLILLVEQNPFQYSANRCEKAASSLIGSKKYDSSMLSCPNLLLWQVEIDQVSPLTLSDSRQDKWKQGLLLYQQPVNRSQEESSLYPYLFSHQLQ